MISNIVDRLRYDVLGMVPSRRPFVFGVGLSKTGTTSLNDALNMIGHRAYHMPPIAHATPEGQIVMDWPWWVYKYDALTDLTPAVVFKDLMAQFPNARFIYTRRPIDAWLDSCRRHFTDQLRADRIAQGNDYMIGLVEAFYGSYPFQEAGYRAAYERHDAEVMQVLGGRDNFMIYDLTQGEGWEPLCRFLDKPQPTAPFPASNKGRQG